MCCTLQFVALCLCVLIVCSSANAVSNDNIDFSAWDRVLKRHVKQGEKNGIVSSIVDYAAIANDSDYLLFSKEIASAKTEGFNETMFYAFWMNAYNWLAVKIIIDNPCMLDMFYPGCGPLKSITQVGVQQPSVFVTVWTRTAAIIGGRSYSLDDIKNDKLRKPPLPRKVDPRFHACIHCASISCPDLRPSAFTVQNLSAEMDEQMRLWLANTGKGLNVDDSTKTVTTSMIFSWYKDDFSRSGETVVDWWIKYAPESTKAWLEYALVCANITPACNLTSFHICNRRNKDKIHVKYFYHDWSLNGDVSRLCPASSRPCFPWWALITIAACIISILIASAIFLYCRSKRQFVSIH